MATISHLVQTVHGNQRVSVTRVQSADAEMNLTFPGIKFVDGFHVQPLSYATVTTLKNYKLNTNSSGTVANGTIGVSGLTSGDQALVTVFGR